MNDFEFSKSLLENFFSQRKIQKSLDIIFENDITGWEIWLQIEFATFLTIEYGDEIEWYREYEILTDGRKEKLRKKVSADFIFRRKNFKKNSYIVLEFKQNPSPRSCFSCMLKDVDKIEKVKVSDIDMRNFWVVGIHCKDRMTKAEIKKYIRENCDFVGDDIYTKFISNTNYAFTIF